MKIFNYSKIYSRIRKFYIFLIIHISYFVVHKFIKNLLISYELMKEIVIPKGKLKNLAEKMTINKMNKLINFLKAPDKLKKIQLLIIRKYRFHYYQKIQIVNQKCKYYEYVLNQILVLKKIENYKNFSENLNIKAIQIRQIFREDLSLFEIREVNNNELYKKQLINFYNKNYEKFKLIKISVVVPIYKTNIVFLRKCIESVLNQIHINFELILVDDFSDSKVIKETLVDYKNKDSRIKIIFLNENKGIVEATNIGINEINSDYITFLDHDDEITCDALFHIANSIISNPNLDYIYTNEERIDVNNNLIDISFKGGWNEIMSKFHNYTHHLSVYSTRILKKNKYKLDVNFNGAQDFELLLRVHSDLNKGNVCHIPFICYRWRSHVNSTASHGTQKPFILNSAKNAIEEKMKIDKVDFTLVQPEFAIKQGWTLFQPIWKEKDHSSEVTIVIPTRNKGNLLFDCIQSIKTSLEKIPKIIIIDDNSDEINTLNIFKIILDDENLNVEIIKSPFINEKFNYSRLMNYGSKKVTTKYILHLNNDIKIQSNNWLNQLIGWMQYGNVGVVGAKLIFPKGQIQHAGVVVGPHNGLADHQFINNSHSDISYLGLAHISREVSAVTGACLLTKTNLYNLLGGLDEINFAVEYNDVDYCIRVNQYGEKIIYDASVVLTHITSASRGNSYDPKEHISFIEKYNNFNEIFFPDVFSDMQMQDFKYFNYYDRFLIKPRLIIFTHALSLTGAPITLLELALEMHNRDFEVHIITFMSGPLNKKYEEYNIKIHDLNLSKSIFNVSFNELNNKVESIISKLLIKSESDFIICNTTLTFIGIYFANLLNIKNTWHIHENNDYYNFISLLEDPELRKIAKLAPNQVSAVIFQSEITRNQYFKYFPFDNSITINGGMPLDRINEYIANNNKLDIRKNLGIKKDDHVISIIGTTCERKGQIEFVEAIKSIDFKKLNTNYSNFKILIIGNDNSDYSILLQNIVSGISNIDICIIDEVPNIYDYYLITDTFVCASKEESFPMVILLAMAFKIPIVSTMAGGIPEMLTNDYDAFLINGSSSTLIREKLILSLECEDRLVMTYRAYEKILKFYDNKYIFNKHEKLIKFIFNK